MEDVQCKDFDENGNHGDAFSIPLFKEVSDTLKKEVTYILGADTDLNSLATGVS